ncbi:MAG: DUF1800 domain-containing protein [Planctomycetota bacterium]|jgi:uncharacterized protein (DUF1800 family)
MKEPMVYMIRRFRCWLVLVFLITAGPWSRPVDAGGLARARLWNEERAAHLLRRAGFGGTEAEIAQLTEAGLHPAVDQMISGTGKSPDSEEDRFSCSRFGRPALLRSYLQELPEKERGETRQRLRAVRLYELESMRAWWLRRMATTRHPLREKMTLFWHGHFTSGAVEVQSVNLMADQNALFRRHAVGSFRDLLFAVTQDPAMLRYLDNNQNRKQHPNENFARELLELFTMGPGHYSENDIREAARAFTGWATGVRGFRFRPAWHDRGTKSFLGERGQLNGDDIVRIILRQRATPEFVARRLAVFFVRDDPPDDLVKALAAEFRRNSYDIAATLRELFLSEAFYSPQAMFNKIKSPVQLVIGTLRTLDIKEADFRLLAAQVRGMGQDLFQPPNVKGWDGGRAWLSSSTWYKRQQFMTTLVNGTPERIRRRRMKRGEEVAAICTKLIETLPESLGFRPAPAQADAVPFEPLRVSPLLGGVRRLRVEELVNQLAHILLQRELSHDQRTMLINMVDESTGRIRLNQPRIQGRLRQLIRAIAALPEFQLS